MLLHDTTTDKCQGKKSLASIPQESKDSLFYVLTAARDLANTLIQSPYIEIQDDWLKRNIWRFSCAHIETP